MKTKIEIEQEIGELEDKYEDENSELKKQYIGGKINGLVWALEELPSQQNHVKKD